MHKKSDPKVAFVCTAYLTDQSEPGIVQPAHHKLL